MEKFEHKFKAGEILYLIPPKGVCQFLATEGVVKVKVRKVLQPSQYSQHQYYVILAEDTLGGIAGTEISVMETWLFTADSESVKRLLERNKHRMELSSASELAEAEVKVGTLLVFKEPSFQTATSKRKISEFARNGAGACRVVSIPDDSAVSVHYYIGQSDYGVLTLPLSAFRKWTHALDVKVSLSYYFVLTHLLKDSARWSRAIKGLSDRAARSWTRKVAARVAQRLYLRLQGRTCGDAAAIAHLTREYGVGVCQDCGKCLAPIKGDRGVTVCASCMASKGYVSCYTCGTPVLPKNTIKVLFGAYNERGDYRQESVCDRCGDPQNRICFEWEDGTLHDRREYEGDARGVLNYSSDVFQHAKASRGRHVAVTLDSEGKLCLEDLNPNKIYYGVELETETRLSAPKVIAAFPTVEGKSLVIPKQDGSLNRELGIELVTLPMTMPVQRVFWQGLEDASIKGKVLSYNKTGGRCGCHIHISRAPMPLCQIQAIDFLVGHEVNRPLTEHIARRLNTSYCVKHKKRMQELGTTYNGGGHHNAVCISSHYPTLEIRIYKGTAAYSGLLIYLDHAESVVEFSAMVAIERKGKPYKSEDASPPGMLEYLKWLDSLPVESYPALRKHLEKLPRKDLPLPESSPDWQAELHCVKEMSAFLPSSSDL